MNDLFPDSLFSSITSKDPQQTAAPTGWFSDIRQAWIDFWSNAFDAARSAIDRVTQDIPELADFRQHITGALSDLQDLISNFLVPSTDQGAQAVIGNLVDAQSLFGETQPLAPPSALDSPTQASAPTSEFLDTFLGSDTACAFHSADHLDVGAALSDAVASWLNVGPPNNAA